MKLNKGFYSFELILITIAILIAAGVYYYEGRNSTAPSENKLITTKISTALPTPYISAQGDWPPKIENSSNVYSCVQGSYKPIERWERTINGKKYCVKIESEGAAGHIYRTYTYTTSNGAGTKTASFTLSWVNECGPYYGGPNYAECQNAQANFNLDAIINSLMQ